MTPEAQLTPRTRVLFDRICRELDRLDYLDELREHELQHRRLARSKAKETAQQQEPAA